ncbi:MAG: 16S rRNA (adenine(1518)-N(6)/adenine(1519)-N(6))-dimethyltransferase RsmA [Bacillota bacterium]
MRAKQSLGQNFLLHQATADRIAESAGLSGEDTVLEIGPGTGMLTRSLLARAGKIIAIEADAELIPVLKESFSGEIASGRLELHEGDIRTFDFSRMPNEYAVVANIPYYITGEIIRTLLTTEHKPKSVTLLVQKEVAERIARSKKESVLSISVKLYGVPRYVFTVPRGAFRPAPKVDSAVLHISNITAPFPDPRDEAHFFGVLHAGFAHKRKRLAKNLEAVTSPETIARAFEMLAITPNARAEDVSLETWRSLTGIL